jgi:hypothetical protein
MTTLKKDQILIYLPVGGSVTLKISPSENRECSWFNPRTAKTSRAIMEALHKTLRFKAPDNEDWILILKRRS